MTNETRVSKLSLRVHIERCREALRSRGGPFAPQWLPTAMLLPRRLHEATTPKSHAVPLPRSLVPGDAIALSRRSRE